MALRQSSHLPATCGIKSASVSVAFAADGQTGIGDMPLAQWIIGYKPTLLGRVGSNSKGWRCPGRDWSRAKSAKSWNAVAALPALSSSAALSMASSNTSPTSARPGERNICHSERGAIGQTGHIATLIGFWSCCAFSSDIRGSFTSTRKATPCCLASRTYPTKIGFLSILRGIGNSSALPWATT
jgi:hypothetical protein